MKKYQFLLFALVVALSITQALFAEAMSPKTLLIEGTQAARKDNYSEAVQKLTAFLSSGKTPEWKEYVERYSDPAKAILAKAQILSGDRRGAMKTMKSMPQTSNLFPNTLAEMGELYAQSQQYEKAADIWINLQGSGLENTFQPEANLGLAYALMKLCQYPVALQMTRSYKAKYLGLKEVLEKALREKERVPLFTLKNQYLSQSVSPAQKMAALEWARVPGQNLEIISQRMLDTISETELTVNLLEADILRLAGTRLARVKKLDVSKDKNGADQLSGNNLKWGRIPASELNNQEVWDDELGSLKLFAKDRCKIQGPVRK